jgi:hypothetical protein
MRKSVTSEFRSLVAEVRLLPCCYFLKDRNMVPVFYNVESIYSTGTEVDSFLSGIHNYESWLPNAIQ